MPKLKLLVKAQLFVISMCAYLTPAYCQEYILSGIDITTADVFPTDVAERNRIARLLNRVNVVTRDAVIKRELWLDINDKVTDADADELARKLRARDIFSEVQVTLIPDDNPQYARLNIQTRDRTSITLGGSGSFVGGVGTVGFTASERNLAGNGDIITLGYTENTDDNSRLAFSYQDIHFINNDMTASIQFGETEDGEFYNAVVASPFYHQTDNFAWDLDIKNEDREVDFTRSGEVVASVPVEDSSQVFSATWRRGSSQRRWLHGVLLRTDENQYQSAVGPEAATVVVPNDFKRVLAGYLIGYDRVSEYKKVVHLDTTVIPQDISIGYKHELLLGFGRREQVNKTNQPEILYSTNAVYQIGQYNYLSLNLDANARFLDGQTQQRGTSLSVKAYALGHPYHKLAARLRYDNNFIRDGLTIESRLGESEGLRGYENDSFAGTQRLLFNLEDRIVTNIQIATVRIGLLGFFDAGWVADRGEDFGSPFRSAGIGLRLSSRQLLGRSPVRIDLSFPLDNDEDDKPLLSIATGQLFSF